MTRSTLITMLVLTTASGVAIQAAPAAPTAKSAVIRAIDHGGPDSAFNIQNGFPGSIVIRDDSDDATGTPVHHNWWLSEDSSTPAGFRAQNVFDLFVDVLIIGPNDSRGGLAIAAAGSPESGLQLAVDTLSEQVVASGDGFPSYSFTTEQGLTYREGESLRLGFRYRPNGLTAADPATIEYFAIKDGIIRSSGPLVFRRWAVEVFDGVSVGGFFERSTPSGEAMGFGQIEFQKITYVRGGTDEAVPVLRVATIARDDALLRDIDPGTGATLNAVLMTLTGETIMGGRGLAWDPTDDQLYGLLRLSGQPSMELVRIDSITGVCNSVGDTGDGFAAIAFDTSGTLYGLTGDGAAVPETLFTINTNNANTSLFLALGNGDDGEALADNPDDALLYHASGFVAEVFEAVDPGTTAVTGIPTSGDPYFGGIALSYEESGVFLLSDTESVLYRITTAGVVTTIGTLDHLPKGIAIIPGQACTTGAECDDGLFCNGTEMCIADTCRPGTDPCPGESCNEQTDECGCLVDADCDDGEPCTADTCDTGTGDCFNDPVPDTDSDGWCDTIDNCPHFSNPDQGAAVFGQTIVALDDENFGWGFSVDMFSVRGDFVSGADIGAYTTNADISGFVDRFFDPTVPSVGAGLWYLVRPDCPVGSWSTGGAGEVPGARDASLP